MFSRALRVCLFVIVCSSWFASPPARGAVIVFKDGFIVRGTVTQQKDFLIDSATGRSFSIPLAGGFYYINDRVRTVVFSPSQVQDVLKDDDKIAKKDLIFFRKPIPGSGQYGLLPGWQIDTFGVFDRNWNRNVRISTSRGGLVIPQRLTFLSTEYARVDSTGYKWQPFYKILEFPPTRLQELVTQYYDHQPEMRPAERAIKVYRYLFQVGHYSLAETLINNLDNIPDDLKETVDELRGNIKKLMLNLLVEDVKRGYKVGQHEAMKLRLDSLFKQNLINKLGDTQLVFAQEHRNKYRDAAKKIDEVKAYLTWIPKAAAPNFQPFFTNMANNIIPHLNVDTIKKLETFHVYAKQLERELKQKKGPVSQSPSQVLALAATGWVMGDAAAQADLKNAHRLWYARDMVLAYQGADGPFARQTAWKRYSNYYKLNTDELAQIIQNTPPPNPPEKITTEPMQMKTPENKSYLVQLPPEYHPHRSYPVLIVLHGNADTAKNMLSRWSSLAKQNGYILAAPEWADGLRASYNYTSSEHDAVLTCIRDLRRRFQVDSDRVFLFGHGEGGSMSIDVGLSHPHLFAGVLSMSGRPAYFALRYWQNAQYLPFYIVDGGFNNDNPKRHRMMLKHWTQHRYPVLYAEYTHRLGEWFAGELPIMFDWMNRKKRALPRRNLGRYHTGGGSGEEFQTMRDGDNKFYWLSTKSIHPQCINTMANWQHRTLAATMQATIYYGNELKKSGKEVKGANIWNQINVRTSGLRNVTIWLTKDMIDFSKPVLVQLNSTQYGRKSVISPSIPTMLEYFAEHGDRQRLYVAKIDIGAR